MEGACVPLKGWQQATVTLGALMDPRRADLIAALGETTGKPAFQLVLQRMKNSSEGKVRSSTCQFKRTIIYIDME